MSSAVTVGKTGSSIEVIAVDDGSSDDTVRILKGYGKQGAKIVLQEGACWFEAIDPPVGGSGCDAEKRKDVYLEPSLGRGHKKVASLAVNFIACEVVVQLVICLSPPYFDETKRDLLTVRTSYDS